MAAAASDARARPRRAVQSLALYRKYRPATFAEVKGQDHVTGPLQQALRTGRINHAYLFSGPRGCGKTSSARILARSLNCVNGPTPEPCGVCDSCVALAPVRPGQHRRDRDRRGLPRRRRRRPRTARTRLLHPGVRPLQDLHHRRGAHGHPAGLQRPAEAGRGAAAAPEVHLRHHRAGEGHPDHPVPHAPLSVPPRPALGPPRSDAGHPASRGRAVEDAVLPLVVRAGAGSVRDSLSVLDQLLAGSDESGLRYDRAVALLGYTDASLLDEIVDAFAAADGAAVFGVVNRVIEGGHEPRRFAADLLDRFRDLIVLAAVPHAARDRPARPAAGPGRADGRPGGPVRPGGADPRGRDRQHRAWTRCGAPPRPGCCSSSCARRCCCPPPPPTRNRCSPAWSGWSPAGRGTRARSGRPPRPARPDSGNHAERARAPAPGGAGHAAAPVQPAAPAEPAAPASCPGGRARRARPSRPAEAPARGAPAPGRPAPSPRPPRRRAGAAADSLEKNWDAVLEAVRQESRVAWMLLQQRQRAVLEDGVLTLRFAREGEMKGFSVSGHDAVLKRVLSADFGLDVMVRGVTGADARSEAGPGPADPGPAQVQQAPARSRPRPTSRRLRSRPTNPMTRRATSRAGQAARERAHRDGPDPARTRRSGDRRDRA